MSVRAARRRLLFPVAALLAVAVGPLLADYRQRYLEGLAALRRGACEEAATQLAAAAAERPAEQARARLVGAIPEPYLPHHYLGLAHYGRRDCAQAEAAWARSAAQGVAATIADAAHAVAEPRHHCALLAEAGAVLAAAADAARRIGPAGPADQHRDGADDAVGGAAAVDTVLAGARERLAIAHREWSLETATAALDAAREAAARLTDERPRELPAADAGAAVDDARAEPVREGERARGAAEPPRAPAEPDPAQPGPGSPSPAGPPATDPAASRPAASASSPLLAAATAYLHGDHASVLVLLPGDQPPGTRRERQAAHLLRAAAAHALYLLGGERDAALLATAHAEAAAVRALAPGYSPDADLFSPRLRALFAGL